MAFDLDDANRIVKHFIPYAQIRIRNARICIHWKVGKKTHLKQFAVRNGQCFYTVWRAPWGGTCSLALAQVVRRLQGKPVFPLRTWKYWASPKVMIANDGPALIDELVSCDWPDLVPCVLCGKTIHQGHLDWWSLDGVSGPYCGCLRVRPKGRD